MPENLFLRAALGRSACRRTAPGLFLAAVVALSGLAVSAQGNAATTRVFASASGAFSTLEAVATDVATADFLFIGEEPRDDVGIHRVELALLQQIAARRGDVILALEMFDRDVQDPLDHLQMGHLDEAEFAREARTAMWPDYARNYKPIVDFAIAKKWPVIAANAPSWLLGRIGGRGAAALEALSSAERGLIATDRRCEMTGANYDRYVAARKALGPADTSVNTGVSIADLYLAQCVKDETMAESVAQIYVAGTVGGKQPLVILINGAFHSDYRLGVVERTVRRLPGKRAAVVRIVPVASTGNVDTSAAARQKADYLIYSPR